MAETAPGSDGRRPRYVWVDMFCASQNLLAGVYRDARLVAKASAAYRARKEDTDALFDGALDAVGCARRSATGTRRR